MSPGAAQLSILNNIEKLKDTSNYQVWRMSIELAFIAMEMWHYLDVKSEKDREQPLGNKDAQARALLPMTMTSDNQLCFKSVGISGEQ